MVSIAGLEGDLSQGWTIQDNASWFGLIALQRHLITGDFTGALQGSDAFNQIIATFPVDAATKEDWGGVVNPAIDYGILTPSGSAFFPFPNGTSVIYGIRGVHDHGTMKAVDFLSWPANGMAPNAVYAAAAGSVSSICRDDTQMGLKIGPYYYLHLLDKPNIVEGQYFALHQYISGLVTGPFDDDCGWADQRAGAYHLHFAFAPSGGKLQMENWTLDIGTEKWTHANGTTRSRGELIGPADWNGVNPPLPPPIIATPTPGPTPTPGGPGDGDGTILPGTPGVTNGTNFWDFITGGLTSLTNRVASRFPESQELQLAALVSDYATLPIRILYITSIYNFKLAFILVSIMGFLEFIRAGYGIYMLIKRALPIIG